MNTFDKFIFEEVINILGQPNKQDSRHAYWQCPDCKDKGQDNIMFTFSSGLLKSWCCNSCRKICSDITKSRKKGSFVTNTYQKPKALIKQPYKASDELKENHIKNIQYKRKCCKSLLNNPKALDYLYQQRGINENTIEIMGLGVDMDKKCFTLPVYDFIQGDYKLIGFEYRELNLANKKIWKEPGTYACLAPVTKRVPQTEIMIILEGFWDAYCFCQNLIEHGQEDYYQIFSPSNGVGSVVSCMENFDFTPYKKVILHLDSDEKGIKAMNEAKKRFLFIETIVMNCGCKDFNEHYMKCIKKAA